MLFSEPKIPQYHDDACDILGGLLFQCSSASRKFLNRRAAGPHTKKRSSFSALQRAENSSITLGAVRLANLLAVSVLFSEPKIPQFPTRFQTFPVGLKFQCSSASRKFLNVRWIDRSRFKTNVFQCSSASRKFLNNSALMPVLAARLRFSALQRAENSSIRLVVDAQAPIRRVSVLFSEPKIPQLSDRSI